LKEITARIVNIADSSSPITDPANTARIIRDQLPAGGLFSGHEWRISPDPFRLGTGVVKEIESLGRVLLQFNRAVNRLYRDSVAGKQPEWVARWLDQGKPESLVAIQRSAAMKNELPRVIRPDLLLTEDGLIIAELDAVPGGIGLTAWLNAAYAATGRSVLGGAEGMFRGFASIFGKAANVYVVVSDESATYRPEMEWLCRRLNDRGGNFQVRGSEAFPFADGDGVYRFFELFDLCNVGVARQLIDAALEKRIRLTPPPRPIFEEKLLFALLWNRNLRDFWRQELGQGFFDRLLRIVPCSWIIDPSPIPPHAAIPELHLTDWNQLKSLSQRERDLILKVSGYSESAWGARGVHLGSDLSIADWSVAVDEALANFGHSPSILQRFHKPKVVDSAWFDFAKEQLVDMPGRVRLCPYYFVSGDSDAARAELGGVLATVCPADKKIIHGMRDAILAPCME
jgi:hypothetical protein